MTPEWPSSAALCDFFAEVEKTRAIFPYPEAGEDALDWNSVKVRTALAILLRDNSIAHPINRCPKHSYPLHWCHKSPGRWHTWWCQECDACWREGDPLTMEAQLTREKLREMEDAEKGGAP